MFQAGQIELLWNGVCIVRFMGDVQAIPQAY